MSPDRDELEEPSEPTAETAESPIGSAGFGTTPAEQHDGEDLSGRLARELPEDAPYPADGQQDRSAEEAAMHVQPGP